MAQDKPVTSRSRSLVPATKAWADRITKESGGTIRTAIFPSEQLGKAFDHYDMARDGIADVTCVNPGDQPGRQIPFTFADGDKGTVALDTRHRKHAAQEMKDTHFCFAFIHDPGACHGRKKVVAERHADASGFQRRTQAGPARLARGVALPDHGHWTARILRAHDRAPSSARMSAQDARGPMRMTRHTLSSGTKTGLVGPRQPRLGHQGDEDPPGPEHDRPDGHHGGRSIRPCSPTR